MPDDILDAAQKAINDAAKGVSNQNAPASPTMQPPAAPPLPEEPAPMPPSPSQPPAGIPLADTPSAVPAVPAPPVPPPAVPTPVSEPPASPMPDVSAPSADESKLVESILSSKNPQPVDPPSVPEPAVKPPEPPSKSSKPNVPSKKSGKKPPIAGIIIGILMLVGIGVGAMYIANPNQLADIRNFAANHNGGNGGLRWKLDSNGVPATKDKGQYTAEQAAIKAAVEKSQSGTGTGSSSNPTPVGAGQFGYCSNCSTPGVPSAADWAATTGTSTKQIAGTYISNGQRFLVQNESTSIAALQYNAQNKGALQGQIANPQGKLDSNGKLPAIPFPDTTPGPDGTWVPCGVGGVACDGSNNNFHWTSCAGGEGIDFIGCVGKTNGGGGGGGGNNTIVPTDTPAPSCANIKIYASDGTTQVTPSSLHQGDHVVIAVTANMTADKARFRANGQPLVTPPSPDPDPGWTDSTTVNSKGEFTALYTMAAATAFQIEAEVHINGAWY